MFHKSVLKNETHPATWKSTAPTQEQMHSPFAVRHQPCRLWKYWEEKRATLETREERPSARSPSGTPHGSKRSHQLLMRF